MKIQYGDYAHWQRKWISGAVLNRQLDFWKTCLKGSPDLHQLPTDRPRPAVQSFGGDLVRFAVEPSLVSGLKQLGRSFDTTLFMTMLALFKTLLYRYSGEADQVVGTTVANRDREEIEPLIGFFVNTLALRSDWTETPAGSLTFSGVLDRIRKTVHRRSFQPKCSFCPGGRGR